MTSASAFLLGARALAPMLIGVVPFGVLYGILAREAGIPPLAAFLMSLLVFAGSAQFLLVQLIAVGAPFLLSLGAVALINLRHALYGASLAPALAHLPSRWKLTLSYLLTDEAYAAAIPYLLAKPRAPQAHWILFGAGITLWGGWQLATLAGLFVGSGLPSDLGLDFALPLTFISILVPLIDNRAHLATALIAGALAVGFAAFPYKSGILLATLAGLAVGVFVEGKR